MVEVVTFGCRINTFESEILKEKFKDHQNLIIVNTCAVTSEAERQCRQTIRKLKKENPEAKIVVTGCAAQVNSSVFAQMKEVDLVLGNKEKPEIEKYINIAKVNPITNKDQFEWFVRDNNNQIVYHDINKVHRLVFEKNNMFDLGFQTEMREQEILDQINQLHNIADTHGVVKRTINNDWDEKTYHFPVAIFEKERQIIFWQGCAKHVK